MGKKIGIGIISVVATLAVCFGIYWLVAGANNTFQHEEQSSRSYKTVLNELAHTKKRKTTVIVIHKNGCKTCQKMQGQIVLQMRKLAKNGVEVSYIEATNGLPSDLFDYINDPDGVLKEFHAPYAIVMTSDNKTNNKLNIAYSLRLNNKANLNWFMEKFSNKN
ncbi:TPA: hypothetical protein ACGWER_001723 [Streptococcus agalactiae]|nr:hypothetical protein [Streptococcus agalactiae]HEO2267372.1 hypothetical protein [Streptococcus agalactiae]HEO7770454.1 hypothetical protein [Streptococcus agalactiae]